MNPQADHEEFSELLAAAALDILEGTERLRLREHLQECADCRHVLAQYEDLVAELALLHPATALDPDHSMRLRARVLARASADSSALLAQARHRPNARGSGWAVARDRWSGWLVAAGLVGVVLMHHGFHRPVSYGWVAAGGLAIVCAALAVYARVLYRRTLEGRK